MTEMVVVHSVVSGKDDPELKKQQISASLEKAASTVPGADPGSISFVSNETELESTITGIIENNVPKVAISGGDGFASLFINVFFKMKAALKKDDYKPDVLFLASGTGNAISYCSKFKNPFTALRAFIANKYKTEPLNMLEVTTGGGTELSHFVSFGADGEIIEIYNAQKRKGLIGYICAVLKYAFSRKLYNPFSRNDANYTLDIDLNGEHIHHGRHEGGGISAIPYIGYGFRPYPLATGGNAHIRFVRFGAILMPTIFKITKWTFLERANRIIYDKLINTPAELRFRFSRPLHIQVSGDLREKETGVRVGFSKTKTLNLVKKA